VVAGAGITVNALGWWDQSPETPLAASHQVGIWDLGGNLLASTTVATGDPLTGAFRYAAIASLALTGGTSYLIGGSDTLADNDDYSSSVNSLVMDPLIA